jgi:transposase
MGYEMCVMGWLEPRAWFKDTLEKLPTWPYSRIDELLPLAPSPAP